MSSFLSPFIRPVRGAYDGVVEVGKAAACRFSSAMFRLDLDGPLPRTGGGRSLIKEHPVYDGRKFRQGNGLGGRLAEVTAINGADPCFNRIFTQANVEHQQSH